MISKKLNFVVISKRREKSLLNHFHHFFGTKGTNENRYTHEEEGRKKKNIKEKKEKVLLAFSGFSEKFFSSFSSKP